jgi:predicted nucleic acid-binding protein
VAARVSPPFVDAELVVDNSAFQRGGQERVRADWLRALEEGRLYRTPILEFEILYSARNAREHTQLTEELEALRPLVAEWATLHREELEADWERVHGGTVPEPIDPLP